VSTHLEAMTLGLAAPPPAASPKPSRTRIKISWKAADLSGRQAKALPQQGRSGARGTRERRPRRGALFH